MGAHLGGVSTHRSRPAGWRNGLNSSASRLDNQTDNDTTTLAQCLTDRAIAHVEGWDRNKLFDDAELEPFRRALGLATIGNALILLGSLRNAVMKEARS